MKTSKCWLVGVVLALGLGAVATGQDRSTRWTVDYSEAGDDITAMILGGYQIGGVGLVCGPASPWILVWDYVGMMEENMPVTMRFRVDGASFDVRFEELYAMAAMSPVPPALVRAIMAGNSLEVIVPEGRHSFPLTGSTRAIEQALAGCRGMF